MEGDGGRKVYLLILLNLFANIYKYNRYKIIKCTINFLNFTSFLYESPILLSALKES